MTLVCVFIKATGLPADIIIVLNSIYAEQYCSNRTILANNRRKKELDRWSLHTLHKK